MPHPNAAKGATWERYVAKVLGLKRSLHKGRHADEGDLEGDDLFVIEAKNDASRSPLQWWKQAVVARGNARKEFAIVVSKVRMPGPDDPRGWATMSLEQWADFRAYVEQMRRVISEQNGEVSRLHDQIASLQYELNVRPVQPPDSILRDTGCHWSPEEAHEPKESHPEWRAATDGRLG